jgi:hypothetical protein
MDDYSHLGGLDLFVILSFIAFALVYFLAPVLGYPAERRGTILISLYLLLGYGLLDLLQLAIEYLLFLSNSNGDRSVRSAIHFGFIFGIFKLVLFLGAQGAFIFGLQQLRRTPASTTL